MTKNRCIFMGTPQIAAVVLEKMITNGIDVVLVVTQPDRRVGRKQNIVFSPVKEVALKHNIEVFQPSHIKTDYQRIIDLNPDVIVTCAYGQIVGKEVLEAPQYHCVNLHGSLLPKYRGAAPIQRAIWNGEKVSGMSLMEMVSKMDAGGVFATKEIVLDEDETSSSLFEKMGLAAADLICEKYDEICSDEAVFVPQDESQVTYAAMISKADEHLDLTKSDIEIERQIRALSMVPGAYVLLNGKKFKILKARYQKQEVDTPFTVLGKMQNTFALSLKDGILYVDECQMEGKAALSGKAFANGQGNNLVGKQFE